MTTPVDPLGILSFSSSIAANLVTDLLKAGGRRFFDNTRLGTKLKVRLGVLDRASHDQIRTLLLETYEVYFSEKYPERQYQVFYDFFGDPHVTEKIFRELFDFESICYEELESELAERTEGDYVLSRILQRSELTVGQIVQDFIDCYYALESDRIGIAAIRTIRELRSMESRLTYVVTEGISTSLRTILAEFGITSDLVRQLQQAHSRWLQLAPGPLLVSSFRQALDTSLPAGLERLDPTRPAGSHYIWDAALHRLSENTERILSQPIESPSGSSGSSFLIAALAEAIKVTAGAELELEECRRIAIAGLIKMGEDLLRAWLSRDQDAGFVNLMRQTIEAKLQHLRIDLKDQQARIMEDMVSQRTEIQRLREQLNAFRPLEGNWLEEASLTEHNLKFYEGYRPTWADIARGLDVPRTHLPVVYRLAKSMKGSRTPIVILSPMGGGKTTFIRRLAYELYLGGEVVLFHKESHLMLDVDEIKASYFVSQPSNQARTSPRPLYIIIDDAARIANIGQFLEALADYGIKAVVIMASRTGEWAEQSIAFTGNLDNPPQIIQLPEYLSSSERNALVARLSLFGIRRDLDDYADSELLIMMMQATAGKGFEQIIQLRLQKLRAFPHLLMCYEYVCLLDCYGIKAPVEFVARLLNTESIYRSYLSEPLLKEALREETNEISPEQRTISAGHELIAERVVGVLYGEDERGLLQAYGEIISELRGGWQKLVIPLLLRMSAQRPAFTRQLLATNDSVIGELQESASAIEWGTGWDRIYQQLSAESNEERCLKRAIELEDQALFRWRYAIFLRKQGKYLKAEEQYQTAIALEPNSAKAHFNYGRYLRQIHRFQEAAREIDIAVHLDPTNLESLREMVHVLISLGDVSKAETCISILDQFDKSYAEIRIHLAEWLVDQGQWLLARRAVEVAVQKGVTHPQAHLWLAQQEIGHGNADNALRLLEDASNLFPSDPQVHHALRELESKLGTELPHSPFKEQGRSADPTLAVDASLERQDVQAIVEPGYSTKGSQEKKSVTKRSEAERLMAEGRTEEARRIFEELFSPGSPEPKDPAARLKYADLLIASGDIYEAENQIVGSLFNRLHTTGFVKYAEFLQSQGRIARAYHYWNLALASEPASRKLTERYLAFLEEYRPLELLGHLQEQIRSEPGNNSLRLRYALLLLQHGFFQEAEQQFWKLSLEAYYSRTVKFWLTVSLICLDRLADAKKTLVRSPRPKLSPSEVELCLDLVEHVLDGQRNFAGARTLLEMVHDRTEEAGQIRVCLLMAELFRRMRRQGESETYFQKALKLDQNNVEALLRYSEFLSRQFRSGPSQEYVERAIARAPNMSAAHALLGWILQFRAGIAQTHDQWLCDHLSLQARTEFEAALDLNPEEKRAIENLPLLMVEQGEPGGAYDLITRGRAIYPDDEGVLITLARVLEALGRADEAEEVFRDLIFRIPASGKPRNEYAEFLRRQSEAKRAIVEYIAATQLGKSPRPHLGLGLAYERVGDLHNARLSYGQALIRQADYFKAAYQLALLDRQEGNHEQAISRYLEIAVAAQARGDDDNVLCAVHLMAMLAGEADVKWNTFLSLCAIYYIFIRALYGALEEQETAVERILREDPSVERTTISVLKKHVSGQEWTSLTGRLVQSVLQLSPQRLTSFRKDFLRELVAAFRAIAESDLILRFKGSAAEQENHVRAAEFTERKPTIGEAYLVTVRAILPFGVIVSFHGGRGLIHRSRMGRAAEDMGSAFQVDDELPAVLIDIREDGKCGFSPVLEIGQQYQGEVLQVAPEAISVRIPGGHGLVKTSGDEAVQSGTKALKPGDRITLVLESLGNEGELVFAFPASKPSEPVKPAKPMKPAEAVKPAESMRPAELLEMGRYSEAYDAYSRKIAENPKLYTLYIGRAKASYSLGDKEGALEDLKKAKALKSDDAHIDLLMARYES